jgi:hypothetical protein
VKVIITAIVDVETLDRVGFPADHQHAPDGNRISLTVDLKTKERERLTSEKGNCLLEGWICKAENGPISLRTPSPELKLPGPPKKPRVFGCIGLNH